jgi:hypothetical protein
LHSRLIKIGLALIVFSILLVIRSPAHAQEENPWSYLRDFQIVEGAVRPVKDGYVATVLQNRAKGLFALVIYAGVCRARDCVVDRPKAFIALDSPGHMVKLHVEPGAKLESMILGFQIL